MRDRVVGECKGWVTKFSQFPLEGLEKRKRGRERESGEGDSETNLTLGGRPQGHKAWLLLQ